MTPDATEEDVVTSSSSCSFSPSPSGTAAISTPHFATPAEVTPAEILKDGVDDVADKPSTLVASLVRLLLPPIPPPPPAFAAGVDTATSAAREAGSEGGMGGSNFVATKHDRRVTPITTRFPLSHTNGKNE